jgi:hypothetical protein
MALRKSRVNDGSDTADWQDFAYEASEKYKEGRYILERELIVERPEIKSPNGRPLIEEIPAKL